MIDAVAALIASLKDNPAYRMDSQLQRGHELYALWELKKLNRAAHYILPHLDNKSVSDADNAFTQLISLEKVDGSMLGKRFTYTKTGVVSIAKQPRARGAFARDSKSVEAWIEWRATAWPS